MAASSCLSRYRGADVVAILVRNDRHCYLIKTQFVISKFFQTPLETKSGFANF